MFFNVTHVRGDHDRFEKRYEASAFGVDDQLYQVAAPVLLAFDVTKDDHRFHLYGSLRTTFEMTCGSCLEPFRLDVAYPFDLRFLP